MSNICQLIIRNFYLQKSIFAVFVFRTPVGDRRGCRGFVRLVSKAAPPNTFSICLIYSKGGICKQR